MGQKVHPVGIRLGVIKNHNSVWYADKNDYSEYLKDDLEVRAYLRKKLYEASVSKIEIQRQAHAAAGSGTMNGGNGNLTGVGQKQNGMMGKK